MIVAPSSSLSTLSSSSSRAVSMMIGTVLSARRRLQTSTASSRHQVEHDEVDVLLGEAGERLLAVARVHDLEASRSSG